MSQAINQLTDLVKALEAGNYDAAPSTLVQGAALQIEDLTSVMNNATYDSTHIKLQKMLKTESCKSLLAQFDRQLSYGQFGGAAGFEGHIGVEDTSNFVRVVVPMCFYSKTRRVTLPATMVATVDGKKADERSAADAAIEMAGELEFDCFRGMEDFSNGGVFDGNPMIVDKVLPNIHGLGLQVRQSDYQANSKDLMFAEYGSEETVVLSAGGSTLTQSLVEDAALRSTLGFGNASKLVVDPVALSAYNKITYGKERIILGGSPQDATGGDLRKQWVSGGTVTVEASQFLRGKAKPARPRNHPNAPAAPASLTAVDGGSGATGLEGAYVYYATACNEVGESAPCAAVTTASITKDHYVTVTITQPGSGNYRYYAVYRSSAGGTAATARYIGKVVAVQGTTTVFTDLGNRSPGFTTGFLLQEDSAIKKELAPYSRMKLAVTDLSMPEAVFQFVTLAVVKPRQNVLIDNIRGRM
jgi:hypothetical protein